MIQAQTQTGGIVIAFKSAGPKPKRPSDAPGDARGDARGAVLFFTGVRYDRPIDVRRLSGAAHEFDGTVGDPDSAA